MLVRIHRLAPAIAIPLFFGCGPMNTKPIAQESSSGGQCNPLGGGADLSGLARTTSMSKAQTFIVQAKFKTSAGSFADRPAVGENTLSIRLLRLDGLKESDPSATLSLEYAKKESTVPRKFTAPVERQPDGTFSAVLNFKRAGNWEITLHIVDSDRQDDHVLDTSI